MSAAICFVGKQSLAGMWWSAIQFPAAWGEPEPPFLLTAADAFLFPFFRDAIMGPNVNFSFGSFLPGCSDESEHFG